MGQDTKKGYFATMEGCLAKLHGCGLVIYIFLAAASFIGLVWWAIKHHHGWIQR